ncbi:MarR family winged helix-turn-helix transcriptional regulator [Olsenella sp. Marseille-QA0557]|uniref:MarR family winged helix-turn-helix transcriptional regulator n=1 Tax=Olsenella sp. Marseille-QA0557 TaxID=3378782 RepID=UPI003D1144F5
MGWSKMRLEYRGRLSSEEMDYEAAAKQLIMYSRGVAKGSIGTAYGMSMGEDPVLEFLSRQENGMSPSDLAARLGYSRPRMTRILDSLETKGYVVRVQDPHDRRRVIATCTDAGIEHAHDRNTGGVSNLAKSLSKMDEEDVRELLRALETAYSLTYGKDDVLGDF